MIQIIGALALTLHKSRSNELACDIPMESIDSFQRGEFADYLIDDKTIRFPSLEARNRCVASYEFEKNKTAFADDAPKWLTTAHDLWCCEVGNADRASGRLLALVHETNDIFSIAANAV